MGAFEPPGNPQILYSIIPFFFFLFSDFFDIPVKGLQNALDSGIVIMIFLIRFLVGRQRGFGGFSR